MNSCKDTTSLITLWLDGELQGEEVSSLEAHLATCATCPVKVETERRFLAELHTAAPLQCASPELRASVEKILAVASDAPTPHARLHMNQSWHRLPEPGALLSKAWASPLTLLVLAAFLVIAVLWLSSNPLDKRLAVTGPSSFAMMAADTHRRYIQRQLPLELVANVPEQISAWFVGKVNFNVKLPDYQEQSGQVKLYSLEGARLVGYREDYAAYVAYRMRQRPISLVVTSESVAQPAGGEEIVSQGLTFHFDSIHGFKVITWSDRGLTYALVSDLEERGQESCVVCHQGSKDRDLIERLKPR